MLHLFVESIKCYLIFLRIHKYFKFAGDYVLILNLPSLLTQSGETSCHVAIKETQVTKTPKLHFVSHFQGSDGR